MSARSKHTAWLVTIALLAVAITASGQQAPTDDTEQNEGTPRRASLLRPALEGAVESLKLETLAIPEPPTGTWGVIASGTGGGAIFRDTDSEAEAWLGAGTTGVVGYGSFNGGYFSDSNGTGRAHVAAGDYGIQGAGSFAGGYFKDSDGSGVAYLGYDRASGTDPGGDDNDGEYGVYARGNQAGGYFEDADGSGYAYVGRGRTGITAYGSSAGGSFSNSDGTTWANIGSTYGISAFASSGTVGLFHLSQGPTSPGVIARLGYDRISGTDPHGMSNSGQYGVYATGNKAGGYFEDNDGTGHAYVGYANTGIWGWGTYAGGDFRDSDNTGYARVGYGDYGIEAKGSTAGGHFVNTTEGGGYAYVGTPGYGISARGAEAGAEFSDLDTIAWALVGYSTYKIYGTGTVSFIQNHPEDPSSVIVYAAPEGDEVATYTRGTARLADGEARVSLGETFKWVTNPDIGLTAHLTPRDHPIPLAVVELSTEEMTVRAPDDAPEGLVFDYIVYGLRIGFEESTVVQEKPEEAYIPSMKDHRELLARRPDLARYTAQSRFVEQRRKLGITEELDTGRAQALVAAIHEFDPAVDAIERPEPPGVEERVGENGSSGTEGPRQLEQDGEDPRPARSHRDPRRVPEGSDLAATVPVDDEGNVYATSFRPLSGDLASLVRVSETVEPGDVLVIDRDAAGMMRRGFEGHDTGVVGVVAAKAGVVLGSQSPGLREEGSIETPLRAEVAMAGVVSCKADAGYGAIWPGDLLVTSATPGHAMRADAPLPGTIVGKALEPLVDGTGPIRVLVMLR